MVRQQSRLAQKRKTCSNAKSRYRGRVLLPYLSVDDNSDPFFLNCFLSLLSKVGIVCRRQFRPFFFKLFLVFIVKGRYRGRVLLPYLSVDDNLDPFFLFLVIIVKGRYRGRVLLPYLSVDDNSDPFFLNCFLSLLSKVGIVVIIMVVQHLTYVCYDI
ncbi:hypothetical protein BD770DRAFT_406897 [Pilaira anomala]|nr:hypothetical protein BD770DRAFT_406897 [Pilaira anomala]